MALRRLWSQRGWNDHQRDQGETKNPGAHQTMTPIEPLDQSSTFRLRPVIVIQDLDFADDSAYLNGMRQVSADSHDGRFPRVVVVYVVSRRVPPERLWPQAVNATGAVTGRR